MEFRPCIDIHNGKVKQIVGGSLKDEKDFAKENFVSEMQAADYAALYREKGLRGGHIILLNAADSPYYESISSHNCSVAILFAKSTGKKSAALWYCLLI